MINGVDVTTDSTEEKSQGDKTRSRLTWTPGRHLPEAKMECFADNRAREFFNDTISANVTFKIFSQPIISGSIMGETVWNLIVESVHKVICQAYVSN